MALTLEFTPEVSELSLIQQETGIFDTLTQYVLYMLTFIVFKSEQIQIKW